MPAAGTSTLTVTPVKITPTPDGTAIVGTVNETLTGTIAARDGDGRQRDG
jgi:hypothetical protein